MEEFEMLQKYRSVSHLILKALKKEIKELGETTESEPVKSILLQRKRELEATLVILQDDAER